MNFIFIGGSARGYKLLTSLIEHSVVPDYSVILKEDEHERGKYSEKIIELLKSNNLNFDVGRKLNIKNENIIKEKNRDFCIVCGWRTIISPELNNFFKLGIIAAHDSLLPKYRGFAPLNWSIINGEKYTGVTLFKINDGDVDSGDILLQKKVKIEKNDYAVDVNEKIINTTIELYFEMINQFKKNEIKFIKQNDKFATYTCKRIPSDGKIVWSESSEKIFNLIRGLAYPYPGAYCIFDGIVYIVRKAYIGKSNFKKFVGTVPGRVIKISENSVEILCGKGTIEIIEWENTMTNENNSPSIIVKSIKSTIE